VVEFQDWLRRHRGLDGARLGVFIVQYEDRNLAFPYLRASEVLVKLHLEVAVMIYNPDKQGHFRQGRCGVAHGSRPRCLRPGRVGARAQEQAARGHLAEAAVIIR
jgi:hypothetical protein